MGDLEAGVRNLRSRGAECSALRVQPSLLVIANLFSSSPLPNIQNLSPCISLHRPQCAQMSPPGRNRFQYGRTVTHRGPAWHLHGPPTFSSSAIAVAPSVGAAQARLGQEFSLPSRAVDVQTRPGGRSARQGDRNDGAGSKIPSPEDLVMRQFHAYLTPPRATRRHKKGRKSHFA